MAKYLKHALIIRPSGRFRSNRFSTNSVNTKTLSSTFEIPLTVVASAAAQTTAIEAGTKWLQVLSAVIVVDVAEVTGTTKTISVGIGGSATNVLAATSVSSIGVAGTPVAAAIAVTSGTNKFSYTLGSANFVEFRGRAIVTAICANA
jgi:CRISPR/Cas system type I-B associated protein Csh2 (Cas7 group RAMP superfamily)